MKYQPITLLSALAACLLFSLTACNSASSYSSQLQDEKQLIADYIKREHINIIYELPEDDQWGEKDYYQVPLRDNFLFHLVRRGDTIAINGTDTVHLSPVTDNDMIIMRYRRYTLTEHPDTASFWTTMDTPSPTEFRYLTDYTNASTAWHIAVGLMRYSGSECRIICPSKLGLSAEQTSVTPYGYDLYMRIKR
ncbi:MAG: DUF4827 family protein [Paludibacteraceae bacterium]|nr:DUF4827 family protein [Paludibacteraceae bacterium]MBR1480620.1 DUF4827 family protein [Paludibacteraceae bacterium]